jgi:CHAT domain-containing protein
MKEGLRKRYPLVHIASHFKFTPGDDTKSYLVLGDGSHLPLSEVRLQNNLFGGVELLTLSACNTGVGDGREVEGFGVLAQRQGAKGVIATLWPVADESTGIFMQNFYQLREQEKLTKAEALQKAQLIFIRGQASQTLPIRRGMETELQGSENSPSAPQSAPYSHPYFWAPFILMGNWL